jgi:hypothetical protein
MSSGATGAAPAGAAGKDLFVEAIKLSLEKGSGIPAIPLLQKALALGLAPGDEVFARHALGEGYREIFGNSGLPWRKMVETNEFHQSMAEIEKAFELDSVGSLGFFSQPLNIGRLEHLDLMYTLAADAKKEQDGTDAATGYLAGKLRAVEYLARPPLLYSLLKLAELYQETGAFEEAARCLRKVVATEPLYPADQERNEELRAKARKMLSDVQVQPKNSPRAPSAERTGYCKHCGNPMPSGARFCTACGGAVGVPQPKKDNDSQSSVVGTSDIASLERSAHEHPDDESYQKLLAVALHDEALANCERDPKDGSLLFSSIQQIRNAREQLTSALALKFNDPQLRSNLEAALKDVNKMEQRKFVGSWFLVIVWGLFYIIPGVAVWAAFRRPRYLMNRDYLDHLRTGKHIGAGARIGGAMGKVYDFCDKISPEWGWIFGLAIFVMLSPIFVLLGFKENYMDVKKEEIPTSA